MINGLFAAIKLVLNLDKDECKEETVNTKFLGL
jgi:hypothetical protein